MSEDAVSAEQPAAQVSAPEAYAYIGKCKDCGAVNLAVVDRPEHAKDVAREVANGIRDGLTIERTTVEAARAMKWMCDCPGKATKTKG